MATTPTIVILGASGSVGTATAKALAGLSARTVAGVRNPDAAAAKNAGLVAAGAKLVKADMGDDTATLAAAIPAGSRVLVVTPGHADRTKLTINGIDAAVAAGAAHIGVVSVTSVASTGIFADQLRPVENHLSNAGVPFTIFRLPMFLDNYLGQPIGDVGQAFLPIPADAVFSSVAVSDVGEALAKALTFPDRYTNRTVTVAGVRTTGADVASAFATALGKKVGHTTVDDEAAFGSMHRGGAGMPEWQTRGVLELFALVRAGDRSQAVPEGDNDTAELLGHAPTSIASWVDGVKGYFGAAPAAPSRQVVVLGASGYVGTATVGALAARGDRDVAITAGVRNPDPAAAKNANLVAANATLVKADMGAPETLAAAIPEGSVVLVVTPGAENRTELALNAINAAKAAGASHIGLVSVTSVVASGVFAEQFRPLENALAASGVPFTVFRLPPFLDNLFGQPIKDAGQIYEPVPAGAERTLVTVSDIGEALANALSNPAKFRNRTLVVGGAVTTGAATAAALTEVLGKQVTFTEVPADAARESMLGKGWPAWQVNGFLELMKLATEGDVSQRIPEGDNDLRELLGRSPTTVAQWAEAVKQGLQ